MTPEHVQGRLIEGAAPLEEVRKQVEAAAEASEDPESAGSPTSKDEPEYSFTFRHKTARGKTYEGRFTTRVLTIEERERVGQIVAVRRLGAPVASFDGLTLDLQRARAHLSFSLKARPPWASDEGLGKLLDYDVVQKLYEEVLSHEQWFLFREVYPPPGAA